MYKDLELFDKPLEDGFDNNGLDNLEADAIFSVIGKDGEPFKLTKADKLSTINPMGALEYVKLYKNALIDKGVAEESIHSGYLPKGFMRTNGVVIHPSGLVLTQKWEPVKYMVGEDKEIYYSSEDGKAVHVMDLLKSEFKYSGKSEEVLKRGSDFYGAGVVTIEDDKIYSRKKLKISNMREFELYISDDVFKEMAGNLLDVKLTTGVLDD